MMPYGLRRPALMLAVALVAVACGGDNLPSVTFVGNDSCPTDGSVGAYSPSPPDVNSQPPVGQAISEMPHTHVAPPAKVQYLHNPPTSGCHYSLGGGVAPIQHGAYDKAIPAEYWVHNLEHGYIAVLYNCPGGGPTGCPDDFQKLRDWLHRQSPDPGGQAYSKIIILPWTTMKPRFALVSWDWYLPMQTLDINQVQRFYDNHVGKSPEGLASL
ncbi:MAG: DUF3105 domain-containing protein [Chloroflexi bacterium]|nr:MAG: DUF3105 domain-containing protein [Chloroflexota bacterium]